MSSLSKDRRIIVKNPTILGLVNEVKWYKTLGYSQSSKITRQSKKDGGNYMAMMTKQDAFIMPKPASTCSNGVVE